MRKKILLGLSLLLVAAQFVRPAKNESAVTGPNDITGKHPVPAAVLLLQQRACYDCHSNNTHYPWYAAVQPVGWWLNRHVTEAKRHLNFSEFGAYSVKRAGKKLEEITNELEEHKMPLPSYTWLHPAARLNQDEITLLTGWAKSLQAELPPP